MKKAELLVNLGGIIGEGICWDETDGMLYWIDLLANKIYSYDLDTNTVKMLDVGQNTGCIAVREKGGLIAGLQHGIYYVDMKTAKMELAASPEADKPGNRFNDGECDCMGRLFAGTMSKALDSGAGDTTPRGSLYRMDPDGRVEKVVENVTISNGIGYSPDNTVMYYIDSPTRHVDAFDYDKATGAIRNRRMVVDVPEELGMPDGLTVDAEGMLWVGMWGGGAVVRFNPATAKVLEKIELPAPYVTTMVFGGADMDEMFVNTAKMNTDLNKYPDAGGVFRIKMDVKGQYTYKFKG
jgi:sugar lactone lactonase YvrE